MRVLQASPSTAKELFIGLLAKFDPIPIKYQVSGPRLLFESNVIALYRARRSIPASDTAIWR